MIRESPSTPASPAELETLRGHALSVRLACLESIAHLGVGHIGGAMSVVEAMTALYFRHMRLDAADHKAAQRDVFVLSKGHAGPALYAILVEAGYLTKDMLFSLNKGGTSLPSHADRRLTPGVDMTTGSLGQGFSAAIGMALGLRMEAKRADGSVRRCFAIIGDGESDEGQVWEAAACAAHYKLDNLIAFTDVNGFQIDGATDLVMGLRDLRAKWEAFGWKVLDVDGHDLAAIDRAILEAKNVHGAPTMILLRTVKAKGVPGLEGKAESHNAPYTMADFENARAALLGDGGSHA